MCLPVEESVSVWVSQNERWEMYVCGWNGRVYVSVCVCLLGGGGVW